MTRYEPGDLVIVHANALVRLAGSESTMWTDRSTRGLVISQSYVWHVLPEGENDETNVTPDYIVLFSNEKRLYHVRGSEMSTPEAFNNQHGLFKKLLE